MVGLAISFMIAWGWSVLALPLGIRLGFVDYPDDVGLKAHSAPASPLGGVGIFVAFIVGTGIEGVFDVGVAVAGALLLIVGLADDAWDLGPLPRLVYQLVAGVLLWMLASLPDAYDGRFGFVAVPVLVIVTVNAVNLLDGLDGLAATAGTLTALGIALLASARMGAIVPGLVIAAALVGFLVLNLPPARVFLGNNGANVLGLALSYGLLKASPDGRWSLLVATAVLGVFLIDLLSTLVRRLLARRPLFKGDRGHIYDQLRHRGVSVIGVVLIAGMVQSTVVLSVQLLNRLSSAGLQLVILMASASVLLLGLAAGGFLSQRYR